MDGDEAPGVIPDIKKLVNSNDKIQNQQPEYDQFYLDAIEVDLPRKVGRTVLACYDSSERGVISSQRPGNFLLVWVMLYLLVRLIDNNN